MHSASKNRLFLLSTAMVMAAMLALLGTTALSAQPEHPAIPLANGVDHTETTTDDAISTTTPDTLVSATVTLTGTQGCVVTASAEVDRTSNSTGTYIFGLNRDTTLSTLATSDRRVEFVATPDTDLIWEEVSTVQGFDDLTGTHTFYFSARLSGATTPTTTVTASGIIVVCSDTQLG